MAFMRLPSVLPLTLAARCLTTTRPLISSCERPQADRDPRTSIPLPLPSLHKVFAALGDESRLAIVRLLLDGQPRTSGEIAEQVSLPASTCSYHLTKLLNADITVCVADGTSRQPVLRREVLDDSLPGLLDLIRHGVPSSVESPSGSVPGKGATD
ncbi:ArsR/SmtB family transcription factor [Streptomyces brasiliensis]|uniref:HTH arsR-type domain-containing protein n=1 Tax=Streptomyces brasiliensis TaxID=1954 RepID=A0A917L0G4_9ACTN|nr:helix-turn-helix domain-containing protein [Streptomyces brasiliensis]GGJ33810.1 hypothetical protein GCM10010121_051200 [Streptomyces brasiliensis]